MSGYAYTTLASGSTSWRAVASEADLMPGETFATEPPAPSLRDVMAALLPAVQRWLDTTAQDNGYDSLFTCISYLNSSIAQYAADAASALAWRDAVWTDCFARQQAALTNPPAMVPTEADFLASLPQPAQFGWTVHAPGAGG